MKNLPSNHRVQKHFPPRFQPSYRSLSRQAYSLRNGSNPQKTRIDYDDNSLILLARGHHDHQWDIVGSAALSSIVEQEQHAYCVDIYSCTFCDLTFPQERKLKHHVESAHQTTKPHTCFLCGEDFSEDMDFAKHRISVHNLSQHVDQDAESNETATACPPDVKPVNDLHRHPPSSTTVKIFFMAVTFVDLSLKVLYY